MLFMLVFFIAAPMCGTDSLSCFEFVPVSSEKRGQALFSGSDATSGATDPSLKGGAVCSRDRFLTRHRACQTGGLPTAALRRDAGALQVPFSPGWGRKTFARPCLLPIDPNIEHTEKISGAHRQICPVGMDSKPDLKEVY